MADEPAAPAPPSEVLADPPCRNCGAPAPLAFCPVCGQETRTKPPTFLQFMREAGGRLVALDGRLWKTLGGLLFRPGFLTREYFAGRRKRYVRPARLFLVASLLLFAALRIVVEVGEFDVVNIHPPAKPAKEGKSAAPAKESKSEAPATEGDTEAPKAGLKSESGLSLDDDFNVDMGGLEIPTLKKRIERFNHLSSKEKEAQITEGVLRYGPYAMFVLLPAFALLLKLVYLGRRKRHPGRPRLYSEHIVFAAHNHAFLFLGIVAATIFIDLMRAVVIAWILVYLVWSMRVVYRGSWVGIALRSFVLVISYAALFAFVTVGLLGVAILLK
ncbi:MAG: DUF3667 domain-containing protein [Casimicrobiaceae bacterium]